MRRIFLVLAVLSTFVPAAAVAGGVTVLVGAQSVSFGADIGEYYDVPVGPGASVFVSFDLGFPVDIRAGRRTATEGGTGRDVTYDWVELGPRFLLCKEGASVCGDWFVGVGSYSLDMETFEFDTAAGGFIGMGVQEAVSDKYVGRFEVKGVYWKSDTFNTDAASLNVAFMVGLQF